MPISPELMKLLLKISSNAYQEESLVLAEQDIDDEGAEKLTIALKKNKHIKKVDLSDNKIGSSGAAFLNELEIESLNLSGNYKLRSGARVFADNQHLEELFLEGCSLANFDAKEVLKNIKLKKLDLGGNNLGDDAVSEIPGDSQLRELILNQNEITSDGARFIAKLRNIKAIYLGSNRIGDDGVQCFAENNGIETLNLLQNNITGKGFYILCKSRSIKQLELFNNHIAFNKEDYLPENSSLIALGLSYNELDGRCHHVLQTLASISTLQKIDLSNNQIDNEGAEILFRYKSPLLQDVKLSYNPISDIQLLNKFGIQ
jgi:Ran GTPase-activating protein (RanGAP) involved in mRNA processing and transport